MLVVFDVNGTLSDLDALRPAFAAEGLPETTVDLWFASTLRDGIAAAATGGFASFAELAESWLRDVTTTAAASRLMTAMNELPVHADVPVALRRLRDSDATVATFTNGSVDTTKGLLGRAELTDCVDFVLDVAAPGRWKPSPVAYDYALSVAECSARDAVLVAAHPWDVNGARRVGWRGAWVNRKSSTWPAPFPAPDVQGPSLSHVLDDLELP